MDLPRAGSKRSAEEAGILDDTRTDHGGTKATNPDAQESPRAGTRTADAEDDITDEARTGHDESKATNLNAQGSPDPPRTGTKTIGAGADHGESQLAKLEPQGPPDLSIASSSMSDLGSFPTWEIVGRAKPTLANVLSARFPELRRMIASDLNLRDRATMFLASHSLRISISSQDHLKPFAEGFSGRCDAKIPMWQQCLYAANLPQSIWVSCTNDYSNSVLRLCEGPDVLERAPCKGMRRGVCQTCADCAYKFADPHCYNNMVPNFGVTPICGTCPITRNAGTLKDCECTGLPLQAGQRHDRDLWLCLECRIARNAEKFRYADDMARAYLYMKKNKHTNTLEYLPGTEIKSARLPTCPCGNARFRTKIKFDEVAQGMCVWCGGLKASRFNGSFGPARTVWDEVEEPGSSTHPGWVADQVLPVEAITAIHKQIKQKGLPPPLPKGANKYWSYASVTDEPRLLEKQMREKYEEDRRTRQGDRKRLNWDDREGFLRNFWWCEERGDPDKSISLYGLEKRGVWKYMLGWKRWEPKDVWREHEYKEWFDWER